MITKTFLRTEIEFIWEIIMSSVSTIFAFLALVSIKQYAGSFFLEKPGSCPMYKVIARSALCDQEVPECDVDFVCDGDLKCCEDERCGVSKCTRPIINVLPTQRVDRCPIEGASHLQTGCQKKETQFCFQASCKRCCTHTNDCNPAKGILVPYEQCQQETTEPPLNITNSKMTVKSGENVEMKCQSPNRNSLTRWSKMVEGKRLILPTSQTRSIKNDFVLKIEKAVVMDSGEFTCQIVHLGKSYSREVQLTVVEPDSYEEVCLMPKDKGSCDGNFSNFNYDVTRDSCKPFQYGGCRGNNNNFASKSECEQKCKGTRLRCPTIGLTQGRNCPQNQIHECSKNEDCKSRRSCCLVSCLRKCIDPSQPSTWQVTTTKKTPLTTAGQVDSKLSVPCGKYRCNFYAKCQVSKSGRKECVCPQKCSFQKLFSICGRDSVTEREKTYRSLCFLEVKSCRLQRKILLVRLGRCYKENAALQEDRITDLCQLKECSPYATCVINRFNGQPQCLCPRFCAFTPNMVCGYDGRTYLNKCFLRAISCKKNLYVAKAYDGPCRKNNV